jgi:hypothetical protein
MDPVLSDQKSFLVPHADVMSKAGSDHQLKKGGTASPGVDGGGKGDEEEACPKPAAGTLGLAPMPPEKRTEAAKKKRKVKRESGPPADPSTYLLPKDCLPRLKAIHPEYSDRQLRNILDQIRNLPNIRLSKSRRVTAIHPDDFRQEIKRREPPQAKPPSPANRDAEKPSIRPKKVEVWECPSCETTTAGFKPTRCEKCNRDVEFRLAS